MNHSVKDLIILNSSG